MHKDFNLTPAKARALRAAIWLMDEADGGESSELHLAAALGILDSLAMDINNMLSRIEDLARTKN